MNVVKNFVVVVHLILWNNLCALIFLSLSRLLALYFYLILTDGYFQISVLIERDKIDESMILISPTVKTNISLSFLQVFICLY